jgi:hypothetical protein
VRDASARGFSQNRRMLRRHRTAASRGKRFVRVLRGEEERGEAPGVGCAFWAASWGLYIGHSLEKFCIKWRGGTKGKANRRADVLGACVFALGYGVAGWS